MGSAFLKSIALCILAKSNGVQFCLLCIILSMNDQQIAQLEIVKPKVRQLLGGDTSGHADDYVKRLIGATGLKITDIKSCLSKDSCGICRIIFYWQSLTRFGCAVLRSC